MKSDTHETETGSEFISPTHVRHIMRYVSALNHIKHGNVVLDCACGTGYGTFILSKHSSAKSVVGVDISDEALQYANLHYKKENNVFIKESVLSDNILKTFSGFDTIVSIETIEHFSLEDIRTYLNNLYNLLIEGGTFIVSTPYCLESGPSPVTKQHLHEFSVTDFVTILTEHHFKVQTIEFDPSPGKFGRQGYCLAICKK